MFSKIYISVVAVFLVALMIASNFASAANTVDHQVTIDGKSANASQYDKVVNVANESAKTNKETWNPVPQGIWIGGSVEESLFQLNQVVPSNSYMELSWEANFSSSLVGSGVADYVVRLPTCFPSSEDWFVTLSVIKASNEPIYSWNDGIRLSSATTDAIVGASGSSTDHSVYDGNDIWTVDNRTYIHCRGPLDANQLYVFKVSAFYTGSEETRFSFYISPDDVANDGIQNSHIGYSLYIGGAYTGNFMTNYSFDLGASYDMRESLGNGVFLKYYTLAAGQSIQLLTSSTGTRGINGYHIAMIPFKTESGTANLSVQVWNYGYTTKLIDKSAWNYRDYVLVSSNDPINQSIADYPYYNINLTANEPLTIGFVFEETSNSNIRESFIGGLQIFYHIQSSYGLATTSVGPLNFYSSSGQPLNEVKKFQQQDDWGSSVLQFFIDAGINLVIGAIPGMPIVNLLYQTVPEIKWGIDYILGSIKNLIDMAWNALAEIGKFLWSIGEAIYKALVWAVNAVLEYGSIVLGLVAVFIIIGIFTYTILWVTKICTVFLRLAQGKPNAAAQEYDSIGRSVAGGAGGSFLTGVARKYSSRGVKAGSKGYRSWQRGRRSR